MCVVSMVADHYWDKWNQPPYQPDPRQSPNPYTPPWPNHPTWPTIPARPQKPISPEEIEELRDLLDRARKYDRDNNQPDCETEDKLTRLKKLAKELGADITFP